MSGSGATSGAGGTGTTTTTTTTAVTGGSTTKVTGGAGGAPGAGGSKAGAGGQAAGTGGASGKNTAGSSGASGGGAAGTAGSAGEEVCTKDVTAKAGQDECTAPLKPEDDRLCKITVGGQQRQFYIYAPKSYNPCKPAALIMDCHGATETAEVHTGLDGFSSLNFPKGYGSGWRRAIQGDNAIVLTPQGSGNMWNAAGDMPFINQAADTVEAIADVDKEKVYITGISMGGMMTVATGCDNSKRWRGLAPVAMLTQSCAKLDRPAPFISFHASTDSVTDYPADQSGTTNVAKLNNCKTGPTDDPAFVFGGPNTVKDPVCFKEVVNAGAPDNPDRYGYPIVPCETSRPETKCVSWTGCDENVEVVFCTVNAASQPLGGHILYHNDTGLQLATVAWRFFKKFW